jgi:hypothetical protein
MQRLQHVSRHKGDHRKCRKNSITEPTQNSNFKINFPNEEPKDFEKDLDYQRRTLSLSAYWLDISISFSCLALPPLVLRADDDDYDDYEQALEIRGN